MTSAVSGKISSGWPCSRAGRPARVSCKVWPETLSRLSGWAARGWGWAACAAAKAAPCRAVEPLAGMRSVNSPSSGMHSVLHTSQLARSWTVRSGASGEGL